MLGLGSAGSSAVLALLQMTVIAMTLGCSSGSYSYQGPQGMDVVAHFADSDGTLVISITPEFSGVGSIERRTAGGELIDRLSLQGFRQPRPRAYLLVDDRRFLLRRADASPTQFGLLPETESPGPLARTVTDWLVRSGGVFEDGHTGGGLITNPHNDHSCAVGADRSLAIWTFRDPASFRATAPGALDASVVSIGEIFCLVADGVPTIAVLAIGRTSASSGGSRLLMFENGRQVVAPALEFAPRPLPAVPLGFQATASSLHLVERQLMPDRALSRIVRHQGVWRRESGRASQGWPTTHEVVWLNETEALVGETSGSELRAARWPSGATEASYGSQVVALADSPFKRQALSAGTFQVSARADYILWMNHDENAFVIESTDQGGNGR